MKLSIWKLGLCVIAATSLIGWNLSAKLPNLMATHWSLSNQVNGYMEKWLALSAIPGLMLLMLGILMVVPKLDPKHKNIKSFQIVFEGFVLLLMLFMSYLQILMIVYNLGYQINMGQLMSPALAILFTYTGFLIKNAKQNWTIGIRTPWTLSNEKVWNKTHTFIGKWLLVTSPLVAIGLFVPSLAIYLLLIPISILLLSIGYSYKISR